MLQQVLHPVLDYTLSKKSYNCFRFPPNKKNAGTLALPLSIQTIDKSALIKLLDKSKGNKLLGLGAFCLRVSFGNIIKNALEAL